MKLSDWYDPEKVPFEGFLGEVRTIGEHRWVPGKGKIPAEIMIVGSSLSWDGHRHLEPIAGDDYHLLKGLMTDAGIWDRPKFITNAVKYATRKAAKDADLKACAGALIHEILEVKPKVIIAIGSHAFKAVSSASKTKAAFDTYVGAYYENPYLPGVKIVPVPHMFTLRQNPDLLQRALDCYIVAADILDGKELGRWRHDPYEVVTSAEELVDALADMAEDTDPDGVVRVAIDCEWEGEHSLKSYGWLRTYQLSTYRRTKVIRCYPDANNPGDQVVQRSTGMTVGTGEKGTLKFDPNWQYSGCVWVEDAVGLLKDWLELLGKEKVEIVGHNIKEDAMWLHRYGLDIRPYYVWDTMLVRHLLNNLLPRGLDDLGADYTDHGNWSIPLESWKKEQGSAIKARQGLGYGGIPDELLLPYAAVDTQVTLKSYRAQLKDPETARVSQRRGHSQEYPSLLYSTVNLSKILMELELTGMPVDAAVMDELVQQYAGKRDYLRKVIKRVARYLGWGPDFNPDSGAQKAGILFGPQPPKNWRPGTPKEEGVGYGYGLIPVKTTDATDGKPWSWVLQQHPAKRGAYAPATDGDTLSVLARSCNFAKMLQWYTAVATICKTFLPDDYESGSGVSGNIFPDGRLHPEFTQVQNTGRLASRYPNVQNMPKAAEALMVDVFAGKEKDKAKRKKLAPKSLRTMFAAPPGKKLLELDFSQAELFVVAFLSNDETMIEALTTPGKDLHDVTTIGSFGVTVYEADGVTPLDEAHWLSVAAANLKEFEDAREKFKYKLPDGTVLNRKEFKTLRIAGKGVNFGILYGRGAPAIADKIEVETGVVIPVATVQKAIDGWKTTYSKAWAFILKAHESVEQNRWVENAWGRRRHFKVPGNESELAASKREGGNSPIQGTVADTMALAMDWVYQIRDELAMNFEVINQIHDALLIIADEADAELVGEAVRIGMSVPIPLPQPLANGERYLTLKVDVDIYQSWCDH